MADRARVRVSGRWIDGAALFLAAWLHPAGTRPLTWDEVDYVVAARAGTWANLIDRGAMGPLTFARFSLAKAGRGDALPERLAGMFAFAVWDEPRRRLLLARDRAGEKPLFVARMKGLLAFASEIKALLEVPHVRVSAAVDDNAFPFYLAYGYVPTPRTFYRGIERLAPGSACVAEADPSCPRLRSRMGAYPAFGGEGALEAAREASRVNAVVVIGPADGAGPDSSAERFPSLLAHLESRGSLDVFRLRVSVEAEGEVIGRPG